MPASILQLRASLCCCQKHSRASLIQVAACCGQVARLLAVTSKPDDASFSLVHELPSEFHRVSSKAITPGIIQQERPGPFLRAVLQAAAEYVLAV